MAIRLVSLVQNARYNDATHRPMSLKLNIFLGQFNCRRNFRGNPRGKMEMWTVMISVCTLSTNTTPPHNSMRHSGQNRLD